MSLLANSNAIESGGYNIQRSLRFRSSASAYLSRTPASAGNRKTWTWSGWVKRGLASSADDRMLFSGTTNGTSTIGGLFFNGGSESLRYVDVTTPSTFQTNVTVTPVYRDFSAWYHIVLAVDTTQATAANRIRFFVNGVEVTTFATTVYPSQNADTFINAAQQHRIGTYPYSTSGPFDGYLAEVNFIDGQALTPSSFGQTDAVTGVWTPKKYTGTYGTNGFYLNFSDNTSATTLAYDKSGNGNNWTANNISTTAGATYDSMTDVPTLTSATAANYATLNPLDRTATGGSWTDGNLTFSYNSTGTASRSTLSASSGKYVAQCLVTAISGNINFGLFGTNTSIDSPNTNDIYYRSTGQKVINGTVTSYGASYTTNDVIRVEADFDAGSVTFFKNGVSQGAISYTLNTGYSFVVYNGSGTTVKLNFGQQPWFNGETPTAGFKALNTFNLPDPTIKKPNQYMQVDTYQGNGTARDINIGMQPDLVWIKSRTSAESHNLFDSVRGSAGNYKTLQSNTTGAEITPGITMVTALNANGFSLGTNAGVNGSPEQFVAWNWKKGATPGFDIVTYTGNGTSQNISHSLGVAPKMIIVKSRSQTVNWLVWHASLATPTTAYLLLNLTDAQSNTPTTVWNSTVPTSTVFSVGSNTSVNNSGSTYVAYIFAEIPGFSKFGSYTGNGSADGPFVYCGFRPKYVMVKRTDAANSWVLMDTSRSAYNYADKILWADLSDAEATGGVNTNIDILSNGIKVHGNGASINTSGGTYVFCAFAENPFKYSLAR